DAYRAVDAGLGRPGDPAELVLRARHDAGGLIVGITQDLRSQGVEVLTGGSHGLSVDSRGIANRAPLDLSSTILGVTKYVTGLVLGPQDLLELIHWPPPHVRQFESLAQAVPIPRSSAIWRR
ncbi:MAG TPA: hypothetical protein VLH75_15895, partial [Longimicrobiales bacterium]|nr:hypothetical protein [Longimicrobiales bacterium]